MRGSPFRIAIAALLLLLGGTTFPVAAATWQAPFDTLADAPLETPTRLTLTDALRLVASKNPSLEALGHRQEISRAELVQAGLRPNPELEAGVEEVGWDAPGFAESEMTVSLSQEFELFGQRGARRQVAQAGIEAAKLEARMLSFDLYLEVKSRFFALAYAQKGSLLSDSSVALTAGILDNISYRFEKGAALQSELMLARLELERANLERAETRQHLRSAQGRLAALWGESPSGISVIASEEPNLLAVLELLPQLTNLADSSREAVLLQSQIALAGAKRQLAIAEARPTISLVGGYKRLQADGSNSFLFGIAIPLPLWNRNQGTSASLEAHLRSLEFERRRVKLETAAEIRAGSEKLGQLVERHAAIDSLLLPTANEAYAALKLAFEAGRVPFTSLLEAERSLIELRFAHNDVLLAIQEEIIALERLTGVTLNEAGN
jgi:cobalt-zinc-cadmium efflux system outer membrane protein